MIISNIFVIIICQICIFKKVCIFKKGLQLLMLLINSVNMVISVSYFFNLFTSGDLPKNKVQKKRKKKPVNVTSYSSSVPTKLAANAKSPSNARIGPCM